MVDMASLYRTQWLMAHNRLHDLAHKEGLNAKDQFYDYLVELKQAEKLASKEA